jgi:hypothetical protein
MAFVRRLQDLFSESIAQVAQVEPFRVIIDTIQG